MLHDALPRPTVIAALLCMTIAMPGCGGGLSAEASSASEQALQGLGASRSSVLVSSLADALAPVPTPDESPSPRASELIEADAMAAQPASQPNEAAAADKARSDQKRAAAVPPLDRADAAAPDQVAQGITAVAAQISSADIAARASAGTPLAVQPWGNVQCYGQIIPSQKVPVAGIQGSRLADGQTLRFGDVYDSGTATGRAFEFSLNVNDPQTARSDRCEIAFAATSATGIPRNTVFWHAFAVKLPDWSSSADEQAIAQWHAGDNSGGLLPVYSLLVRGSTMRLVLRFDDSAIPSRSTTKALVVWSTSATPVNRWVTFVTQALVSTDRTKAPFINTWLDGRQVVTYAGPVGYNQPTVQQYAKHGIYHWIDSTNTWNLRYPTRSLRLAQPMLIQDPSRKYQQDAVRAAVEGR